MTIVANLRSILMALHVLFSIEFVLEDEVQVCESSRYRNIETSATPARKRSGESIRKKQRRKKFSWIITLNRGTNEPAAEKKKIANTSLAAKRAHANAIKAKLKAGTRRPANPS